MMTFEEYSEKNKDHLMDVLEQLGATNELDFDLEKEEIKAYDDYLDSMIEHEKQFYEKKHSSAYKSQMVRNKPEKKKVGKKYITKSIYKKVDRGEITMKAAFKKYGKYRYRKDKDSKVVREIFHQIKEVKKKDGETNKK